MTPPMTMAPSQTVVREWYERELGWTRDRYEKELGHLGGQIDAWTVAQGFDAGTALTVTDLFAGAGGSSTGMIQIPGIGVVIAANHWGLACETHNLNHPNTDHATVDLHQENPAFFPKTDILWASPECTKWSQAGVGKSLPAIEEGLFEDPASDEAATRSRLLMFDVLKFVEYHRYRAVIVENVVDIATNAKYRLAWAEWRRQLTGLGYRFQVLSLNSMHAQTFGPAAPQSRDRLYVVAWRAGERAPDFQRILRPAAFCPKCDRTVRAVQSWKNGRTVGRYRQSYVYVHSECGTVVEPAWLPAAAAIDWSIPGEPVGDRLAPKTRARIAAGIARYWGPLHLEAAGNTFDAADPKHRSHGDPDGYYRAWPMGEELRSLHTTASKALAVPSGGTWNEDARPVGEPHRTLTAREAYGVARPPFVVETYGTSTTRPVSEAAAAFTAGGNHHLLATETSTEPVAEGAKRALVMANNHVNRARPIREPMPTFTTATGGGSGLVVPYYSTRADAAPTSEPVGTLPTRDRFALVTRHYGVRGGDPARHTTPASEHLRTVTATGGNMSLTVPPAVDPQGLVHRHNTGGAGMTTPMFEELRTLTCGGTQSLLRPPRPKVTAADLAAAMELVPYVLFRMFRPHEVAAGMAFPSTYRWDAINPKTGRKASNADLVRMAGNAVTPPAARDIIACVAEAIVGDLGLAA